MARVGAIGLDLIGGSMAARLVERGHEAVGYDDVEGSRTRAPDGARGRRAFAAHGGRVHDLPVGERARGGSDDMAMLVKMYRNWPGSKQNRATSIDGGRSATKNSVLLYDKNRL